MGNIERGAFITLEGPEGAGKTTQVKLLSKQLDIAGIRTDRLPRHLGDGHAAGGEQQVQRVLHPPAHRGHADRLALHRRRVLFAAHTLWKGACIRCIR